MNFIHSTSFAREVEEKSLLPNLFVYGQTTRHSILRCSGKAYTILSDMAFNNSYTDQSHFIRDFKEFSGLNPSAYENRQMSFICQHREWNGAFN